MENLFQCFYGISKSLENYPLISAIVANGFMGAILWLSFFIPQKFVNSELKKIRKVQINKFDKTIILISGIIFSIILCVVGSELLSGCVPYNIPNEYIAVIVMFSSLCVFVRSIGNSNLIDKSKIPSHVSIYRIATVSFCIVASSSVIIEAFPSTQTVVVHVGTILSLIYFFAEIYYSRSALIKSFVVLSSQEYSMGAKLVEFINKKFVFIALFGMVAVPLLNQRDKIPENVLLYCNIRNMFAVIVGMFVLQVIASWLVNRFIQKLDTLEAGKSSKKSAQSRRKNLLWICDVLTISSYLAVILTVLWYVGVNIQKYIFHDVIVTIGLVIFGTILLYNAFKEFTDALVEKYDPQEHEKVLTFIPVISIIFNIALIFVAALIILSTLGVAVGPLLASFTVITITIGAAAKDILKGFIHGIILLFENNFYMGDFITINNLSGTVIKISARTITLRSSNGDVYSIPYDAISTITNHSRDFYIHTQCLLISPHSDIDKASKLLVDVVDQLRKDPEYADKIFGDLKVLGIPAFSPEGIKITWTLKTASDVVGRYLYLEIYKRLFPMLKEEHIKIPYSQERIAYLQREDE